MLWVLVVVGMNRTSKLSLRPLDGLTSRCCLEKKSLVPFSWRVRGNPPPTEKDRVNWTYEIPECSFDKEAWVLRMLCAPPRSKPAQFEPVKGPKRLFRQNSEVAIESSGKGQSSGQKKDDNDADMTDSAQQPEGLAKSTEVPPTVIDVENSQTDQGISKTPDWFVAHQGWQIIDHGGAGDCFFRAMADNWHWTSKTSEISAEKATTEGA